MLTQRPSYWNIKMKGDRDGPLSIYSYPRILWTRQAARHPHTPRATVLRRMFHLVGARSPGHSQKTVVMVSEIAVVRTGAHTLRQGTFIGAPLHGRVKLRTHISHRLGVHKQLGAGQGHDLGRGHHAVITQRPLALGNLLPRVSRRILGVTGGGHLHGGSEPAHVANVGRAIFRMRNLCIGIDDIIDEFLDFFKTFWESKDTVWDDRDSVRRDLVDFREVGALGIGIGLVNGQKAIYHTHIFDDNRARLLHSASLYRLENDEEGNTRNIIGMANRYLHYKEMLFFRDLGLKKYDWGGAGRGEDVINITEFKESFGGYTKTYYDFEVTKGIKAHIFKAIVNIMDDSLNR